MENDEKKCPFCAEVIKAEAIKCKHCGSMLAAEASRANQAHRTIQPKKGIGPLGMTLIIILIGGMAFLGFGFYLSSTPEGKARSQARAAIDQCHEDLERWPQGSSTWRFVYDTCKKMERDLRNGKAASAGSNAGTNYPAPKGNQSAVSVGQVSAPLKSKVFLRSSPDLGAAVVREALPGETLVVQQIAGGWIQVSSDEQHKEWAMPDLVDW